MTVFIVIGFAGFLIAALLTGTFVSGDQQRANFYTETKEDRRTRSKIVDWLAGVSLASFGIAGLIHWLS